MEKKSQNRVRKYLWECFIFGIVLISLWILLYFIIQSYIGAILSLLIMLILMKVAIRIIANKTLLSVLIEGLDAYEFLKIVNDKRLFPPLLYRIHASISVGDYQSVVNIATSKMQQEKCALKIKFLCLCTLARAYFELGDYEKLKTVCVKYEEYRDSYPNASYLRPPHSLWTFYQDFLNHNYEACQALCEKRNTSLKPKAAYRNYHRLQNNFYCAVACYSNNEFEKAKKMFEVIMATAPNMHLAKVSQKYVEAIESNSQPVLYEENILPQDDYQLHSTVAIKRARRNRKVICIFLSLFCVSGIALEIIDYIDEKKQYEEQQAYLAAIAKYENELNVALAKHYTHAKFVVYFNVEDNDQIVGSLCVVDTPTGLDIVKIVTYDGGTTTDILFLAQNLDIGELRKVRDDWRNCFWEFQIFTSRINSEDFHTIIEFTLDDDAYWLGINFIETPHVTTP